MDGFSLAIDQRVVPLQGNGSTVLTEMPRLLELSFHNATELPAEFSLSQNYPNPFNPTTELSFTIGRLSLVTMKVYDVLGREVATIVNEELTLGRYSRSWDASKVPSGVYYVRMVATDRMGNQLYQNTRKLVLMK